MAREALYVAMTRGRHANHLYVPTDPVDPDCDGIPDPQPAATARQVLTTILATSRRELSATETTTHAADQATSLARLVPIRDTLAAAHDRHTWQQLAPAIGLTAEQTQHVLDSPAAGPLLAAIRHGQAAGHPMERVLAQLIRGRPLHEDDPAGDQSRDLAAVLHRRVSAWLDDSPVPPADPAGDGDASERLAVLDPDLALGDDHDPLPQALRAVDALIRHRVDTLTDRPGPHVRAGCPPTRPGRTAPTAGTPPRCSPLTGTSPASAPPAAPRSGGNSQSTTCSADDAPSPAPPSATRPTTGPITTGASDEPAPTTSSSPAPG